jgi:hypothetical protein
VVHKITLADACRRYAVDPRRARFAIARGDLDSTPPRKEHLVDPVDFQLWAREPVFKGRGAKILRLYHRGDSPARIGEILGIKERSVWKTLNRNGITKKESSFCRI